MRGLIIILLASAPLLCGCSWIRKHTPGVDNVKRAAVPPKRVLLLPKPTVELDTNWANPAVITRSRFTWTNDVRWQVPDGFYAPAWDLQQWTENGWETIQTNLAWTDWGFVEATNPKAIFRARYHQ